MLTSYKWLSSYFNDKLPTPEKVAELFTFHAFEIEGVEKHGDDDTILDVKVLPDRAHYALSHRGIAGELSAILNIPRKNYLEDIYKGNYLSQKGHEPLSVSISEEKLCLRYIARQIDNIKVDSSPAWLRERLEAVGQRSINYIVDATNFVMFDIGQPLHAFDARKVVGGITVRLSKVDEKITTLDGKDTAGKEIILPTGTLVIADDMGPLAIAGVKGGSRAAVTEDTQSIILEAANFNASSVRMTSTKVGIRNDASKRFENGLTPELAKTGMDLITSLIATIKPNVSVRQVVDIYPQPQSVCQIKFSAGNISRELGVDISQDEIVSILKRLGISVSKDLSTGGGSDGDVAGVVTTSGSDGVAVADSLVAVIPPERLDLVIPNDLTEEVGRLYGYDKVPAVLLPMIGHESANSLNSGLDKRFYWEQKIRSMLAEMGFSEVYTHTLTDSGPVEIQNPLASDKCAMRKDLSRGIGVALELNTRNLPLLGIDQIRIFEIGKVYDKPLRGAPDAGSSYVGGEHSSLALGIGRAATKVKGKTEMIDDQVRFVRRQLLQDLAKRAGSNSNNAERIMDFATVYGDGTMELDLDALIDLLPEPSGWDIDSGGVGDIESSVDGASGVSVDKNLSKKYSKISPYPFVLRDIAVFVPEGLVSDEVKKTIVNEAGSLLVRCSLFDVFTKKFPDGSAKTSHAFNLVFQSQEKTLSEAEINEVMKKISDDMARQGWQVR